MKNLVIYFLFIIVFSAKAQVDPLTNSSSNLSIEGDIYASNDNSNCATEMNGAISKFVGKLNLYTQNIEYQKDNKFFIFNRYSRVCLVQDSSKRCFNKVLNLDKEVKIGLVEELFVTNKGKLGLWKKPSENEAMDYGGAKKIEVKFFEFLVLEINQKVYVFHKSKKGYKSFIDTFQLTQKDYLKEENFFEKQIEINLLNVHQ